MITFKHIPCLTNAKGINVDKDVQSMLGDVVLSGRGRARRHGEGEAGQQEDSLQPPPCTRGSTFPAVQPQEHGEPC